jgi:MYXO-CTERM domain-containing protein
VSLVARDKVGNMSAPAMINFTVEAPAGGAPTTGMADENGGVGPQVVANGQGGDDQMHVVGGCALANASAPAPCGVLLALAMLVGAALRRRRAR